MILKDNCFGCTIGWSPKTNAVGEGLFGRTLKKNIKNFTLARKKIGFCLATTKHFVSFYQDNNSKHNWGLPWWHSG